MKKIIFPILAIALIACKPTNNPEQPEQPAAPDTTETPALTERTISFENATLDENNVMFNAPYSEDILNFSNHFESEYLYWEDFAISAVYDDTTTGFMNMYGSISASAYEGNNFAVVFHGGYYGIPTISAKQDFQPQSLRINNSTYCYFDLLNGSAYSKKFEAGDYFYITATGYDANGKETDHADFYLADFRDGKSIIVRDWTLFDLTPLDTCRSIKFSFTSTDMGDFGMNTPAYAIIDNLIIKY